MLGGGKVVWLNLLSLSIWVSIRGAEEREECSIGIRHRMLSLHHYRKFLISYSLFHLWIGNALCLLKLRVSLFSPPTFFPFFPLFLQATVRSIRLELPWRTQLRSWKVWNLLHWILPWKEKEHHTDAQLLEIQITRLLMNYFSKYMVFLTFDFWRLVQLNVKSF